LARSVDVADSVHANRGPSSSADVRPRAAFCQPKLGANPQTHRSLNDSDLEPLSHGTPPFAELARTRAPRNRSRASPVPRAIQESHNFLAQSQGSTRCS